MKNVKSSCRGALSTSFVVVAALLAAPPADAQLDLTGNWSPPRQEDRLERGPGPALVDYLGLPINSQGRQFALSLEPVPVHVARTPVPGPHRGLHLPGATTPTDMGRTQSRLAGTDRDQSVHQHL